MYPAELEIKDTTERTTSASYLDLLLSIGRGGQLHTSIYDKRDDFPFLNSYIQSSPAYVVLSLSLYDTPGFSINILFWGPDVRVIQIAITRGTLEIGNQEVLWSIRRAYLAIWNLPLNMLKKLWPVSVTVTSQPIRLSTIFMNLLSILTFIELLVVSMTHLQRVWHVSRWTLTLPVTRFRPDHLFGLACDPIVKLWPLRSRTCRVFSRLFALNIPR